MEFPLSSPKLIPQYLSLVLVENQLGVAQRLLSSSCSSTGSSDTAGARCRWQPHRAASLEAEFQPASGKGVWLLLQLRDSVRW